MSGKRINFEDKKKRKSEFYKNKKINRIEHIDVNKILNSKKEPYGTKNSIKCFIGYNGNDVIRPLCIRLPKITGYARNFDENATMSLRVNNEQLLKNHNKIWEKIEKLLKIDFESKTVYGDDDKYIKTKTKIYTGSMITIFHNKKMHKEKALIMLDSVIKANKKYYPQSLSEESKYLQETMKTEKHIDDDLEKSESYSDSNDETESDIDNDEYDE